MRFTLICAAAAAECFSRVWLCNPIDGSPSGSAVPGILQAWTLEWVAISFSNAWKWKVKVKLLSHIQLSNPMDYSLPGSSIHGIFQARVLEWGAIAFSELICEIVNKSRKSKRAGLWRSKKRQREIPRGAKDGLSPAFSLMWSCLHHK